MSDDYWQSLQRDLERALGRGPKVEFVPMSQVKLRDVVATGHFGFMRSATLVILYASEWAGVEAVS